MCDFLWALAGRFGASRWWLALAAGLLLAGGACRSLDLRGEGFPENEMSDYCAQYRKTDPGTGPAAVTNKAMQIERNFGVR